MSIFHIVLLAVIQGAAELLPVSSSAHVIVAEKLLGLDPARPEMTLLLVMLHTGTMFAVLFYYWKTWRAAFFPDARTALRSCGLLAAASALTGILGLGLKALLEKVVLGRMAHPEVESLFGDLGLISAALALAGALIIHAGLRLQRRGPGKRPMDLRGACCLGAIQALCLPFRGFSRSGVTISAGLLLDLERSSLEAFSFALAVLLTPAVLVREILRVLHAQQAAAQVPTLHLFLPGLLGMALAFAAGLAALRWLSSWLANGRWHLFGFYCLGASALTYFLSWAGL
jgi:undecaprenyl-diphosphatase